MTITYDADIPRDFLPIIQPRIESLAYLMPNWCQVLHISYSFDNPNEYVLSCKSEYAYRMVNITVFDTFFVEEDWRGNIIHEIIHAVAAPYSTEAWHIYHLLKFDPEVMAYIDRKLTDAEEAMAQDMTDLIKKLEKSLDNPTS